MGNGIISLDSFDDSFNDQKVSFFIPASGSGSRMFSFLREFVMKQKYTDEIKLFFESIKSLALYKSAKNECGESFDQLSDLEKAKFVLEANDLPKGLIPFHIYDDEYLNPFQEQIIQAKNIFPKGVGVHFTVQEDFKEVIAESVNSLGVSSNSIDLSYSSQSIDTNAYCFDEHQKMVMDNGSALRRPAGHGALLSNLNDVDADILLIKNIDNIQHQKHSESSTKMWRQLLNVLDCFKSDLLALKSNFTKEGLIQLNKKYQFLHASELNLFDETSLEQVFLRPTRICGMVKNEGAPGGGPFWIKTEGVQSKQIIEKVQISNKEEDQELLKSSSHFNPVIIAAAKTDVYGNRLDITKFSNSDHCIVVKKDHKGQTVNYRELPGLWNGAMSNWNTIFVEVSGENFTPVKTVLDLLAPLHSA